MANVKLPRKEIEKHIKLNSNTIEKISLFGTPLEFINKDEIEIEVFPNRPDLLSFQGFIRSFKAFIGKETGLKKYKINKPEKNYSVEIKPSVKDVRPYTACAIVKNLSLDNEKIIELINLQEKLHSTIGRNRKKVAIGIYPLDKITLPIIYEARNPSEIKFTPLDSDKEMSANQILQKHPAGKEYAHLLSSYSKYPIFVDSSGKILSMPPIINSNETGKITESTKDVFVECSGWHLETLSKTLNIIITTLSEMSGKVYQISLNYGKEKILTPDMSPEKMKISLEKANSLLGLNIKESDLSKLLQKMGYDYKKKYVHIPAWRTDILHEVDIIEDIAIAYGYDKLEPQIPNISTSGEESQKSKLKSKISEILIGLGLLEASSFHLITPKEAEIMKIANYIEVANSKVDYKILRQDLLTPSLRMLSENKDNEYPQKFFEIGTVFLKDNEKKTETSIKEEEHLAVVVSPSNFTQLKQILDYLTSALSLNYELKESSNSYFIEGRTGLIIINKNPIGYIGEIHPEKLKDWNIKIPASAIEISLENIYEILSKK